MDKDLLQMVQRALTTDNTTQLQVEDVDRVISRLTPEDTPLVRRLRRSRAKSILVEWNESELDSDVSSGKYAEGGAPDANTDTFARKQNHIMQIGKKAKASGLVQAVSLLAGTPEGAVDALEIEMENKMMDQLRSIEYFLWNGDHDTYSDEMDGILQFITTNVYDHGNVALTEARVRQALTDCYKNGGAPNVIYAHPEHAVQIAAFTDDKVRYNVDLTNQNIVAGSQVLYYRSPFGKLMEVIPVREDFLPSGTIVMLEERLIDVPLALPNLVVTKPLSNSGNDADEFLLKSYLTLRLRLEKRHAKITGVAHTNV